MGALRIRFQKPTTFPSTLDAFNETSHGATYMARAEMEEHFGFLLNGHKRESLRELSQKQHSAANLKQVLAALKRRGLAVYAVDLTTDEARRCGMCVVRALIPGLQPLSFNYLAQFRGHPRLYDAPLSMGYPSHNEDRLNPWPQPFM
jgi:ribosomal protein S12 methylthiotransferase accessory factor